MTTTLLPAPPDHDAPPAGRHRHSRGRARLVTALTGVLVLALLAVTAAVVLHRRWDDADRDYLGADGWPVHGQAAYAVGGRVSNSPDERPVPIASLAKVMTAYLVLRSGPDVTLTITAADVADTARRRSEQQSVVPVRTGETLTEQQALLALLLPSANNVAVLLARQVAGSVPAFVARMNAEARSLGMTRTHYTDPSGFDASTVSTAHDQTLLAQAVGRDPRFEALAARSTARLPVAGTVRNTDVLLGKDGFVGTKTGSDDAAGGCFLFRTYRVIGGRVVPVVGAVLGQRGHSYVLAGQYAAPQLANRVAPHLPG